MEHSPGFLKMIDEARTRVEEIDLDEARRRMQANPKSVLVDVREDREYAREHAQGALHIGKGVLERDLEQKIPDPETELILYCGGGYRSVLAADAARKMGYKKATSLQGGYKAMVQGGWPMESESGSK